MLCGDCKTLPCVNCGYAGTVTGGTKPFDLFADGSTKEWFDTYCRYEPQTPELPFVPYEWQATAIAQIMSRIDVNCTCAMVYDSSGSELLGIQPNRKCPQHSKRMPRNDTPSLSD